MKAQFPVEDDGEAYFRLAWATDPTHPHPFGKRYRSRKAAQRAAPQVNRDREASGLTLANYVLELKRRPKDDWPFGRYVAGERFPLPRKRIAKARRTEGTAVCSSDSPSAAHVAPCSPACSVDATDPKLK